MAGACFRPAAAFLALVFAGVWAAPVLAEMPASPGLGGDAARGAKLYTKCRSCHMVGPDARNRVGPHLNELFGRRAAGLENYRYSADMKRAGADGLTWTAATLHIYIENPRSLVTGTRMAFRGVPDPGEREDLIAFLRQYSASPQDIPEAAPTAAPTDPDVHPDVLAIKGDTGYGEYLAAECVTCHQATGADEGIPSITGWPERDFVTAMHAYKNRHRPHPVMRMIAGTLSDEEIAALAAYFRGVN